MLRELIASCLLGFAALSAVAEGETSAFSYAGDELSYWGKGKSEIYDVAIRIEDPALVGKKITGIRALVNAYEGIESTSVWLSEELTLEKIGNVKVTVPDTFSAEVTPEKIPFPGAEDYSIGQLSVTLDSPYEITEDGIYVGYSLTVPAVEKGSSLTDAQQYPVLLSPSGNPLSLYIRASKDFLKWLPYNERLGMAAAIYVTLEGEFAEYCVGIRQLDSAYVPVDKEFSMRSAIYNHGQKDVSSIGYTYTVGGRPFGRTIEFAEPISPDIVNSTVVDLPIDALTELGDFTIDLTIDKVNGMDNFSTQSSASASLHVLPYLPVHRPMLEEFTGTWCGWCIRGYIALESLNEEFGDNVVLAAYHDGDPMQADDFPVDPVSLGFPSALLNRVPAGDPYLGTSTSGFGMKGEVEASLAVMVPADIQVYADWTDADRNGISVRSVATFFEDKVDAGYKIGYILLNNGLTGAEPGWLQKNYFPKYAVQYAGTDLEFLTKWPSIIPNLVFNDVVVDASGVQGVDGSIPVDIAFNTPYVNEFSFDISGNTVIQDKDKLYVAAFIINPDGTILNAVKTRVGGENSVDAVDSEVVEVSAEYFSLSGLRVPAPLPGVCIKMSHMSDGSVRTRKVSVLR
ncbi:MAG: hypothetical protein K2H49_01460 [Muribaculaceae bacterium]|nr:hypothetical protein [Muribaculaceae bacterium]